MQKDIGFWDIDGNYIPDIQDVDLKELEQCNEKVMKIVTKLGVNKDE